jgi:hypothetical protein
MGALDYGHKKQGGRGATTHNRQKKVQHALQVLAALNSKLKNMEEGGGGATHKRRKKLLGVFGVLKVLDSTHKKQRGGGGGGDVQHAANEKKMLYVFGVLGALDFGHKKHKGGGGVQHTKNEEKCFVCLELQNHKVHR